MNRKGVPETPKGARRWWLFGAALVVAIALAGSVVEIFYNTAVQVEAAGDWSPRPLEDHGYSGEVSPARTYTELRDHRRGPNADWTSNVAALVVGEPPPETPELHAEKHLEAVHARAERRAFEGAPPVIPHAIEQRDATACLACHGEGLKIGDKVARKLSHPPYQQCTQCHAPVENTLIPPSSLEVANAFVGRRPSGRGGLRAWEGAPPQIPHSTQMRDNCNSCHGPWGAPGLRTTHPERRSCTQCHAVSAELDQRTAWLPGATPEPGPPTGGVGLDLAPGAP